MDVKEIMKNLKIIARYSKTTRGSISMEPDVLNACQAYLSCNRQNEVKTSKLLSKIAQEMLLLREVTLELENYPSQDKISIYFKRYVKQDKHGRTFLLSS